MTDRPRRTPILLCAALLAVATATGCEDATARQRAANQKIIAEQSKALAMISFASGDQAKTDLRKIDSALGGISGAEGGQQTAADLLQATVNRELAGIGLLKAERLESALRRERAAAHDLLNAAVQLDTLADSRERLARDESRSFLETERESAIAELGTVEARLAELDGPIAERVEANEADWQRAAELKTEASEMRRTAAEQGRRVGLPTYLRAIQLEQEADAFEIEVARRENDLRYDLEPEHSLATSWADHYNGMLVNIEAAEDTLSDRANASAALARQMREEIASFDQKITARLATITAVETESAAELDPDTTVSLAALYEEVSRNLNKAATSVARTDDAGRIAATRVYAMQGQLHRSRALAASDQAVLLGRIVELDGAVGDPEASRVALDASQASYEQYVQEAIAAYEKAKDTLGQIRKKSPEIEVFTRELDRSIASLTGESMPEAPPAMSGGAPGSGAPAAGTGAASSDELLAIMREVSADPATFDRLFSHIYTATPKQRQNLDTLREFLRASSRLQQAVRTHLGDEAADQLGGDDQRIAASLQNATIISEEAERVIVSTPSDENPDKTMVLINVDGRWWLDAESLKSGGQGDAESLALVAQMVPLLDEAVAQIEAGEIDDVQEIMSSITRKVMEQTTEKGMEKLRGASPSTNE